VPAVPGWESYDAVAAEYDRVWHPTFEPVARDLVDLVGLADLPANGAVLDVGTGTGVVAAAAAARRLPQGAIVGVDPSASMLELARTHAPLTPVVARAPGLPFPDAAFDAVVANLVLSHFERYDVSLADMVRLLRPGGRLGVTAWGALDDEPVDDGHQRQLTALWKSIAKRYLDTDAAADWIDAAIPWEGWFGDPAHLRGAFEGIGLRDVALQARAYRAEITQREMLAGFDTSFWGRYVRHALGDADWRRFRHDVAETAHAALPDPITRVDQLLIAIGRRSFATRP
jgi:ubiquinone/menaquinone biosynthesis C-methylase UbiE